MGALIPQAVFIVPTNREIAPDGLCNVLKQQVDAYVGPAEAALLLTDCTGQPLPNRRPQSMLLASCPRSSLWARKLVLDFDVSSTPRHLQRWQPAHGCLS